LRPRLRRRSRWSGRRRRRARTPRRAAEGRRRGASWKGAEDTPGGRVLRYNPLFVSVPDDTDRAPALTPRHVKPRARSCRWLGVPLLLAAAGSLSPVVLLQIGTRRSMECVASYEASRGPTLPDCRSEIRWFVTPSRAPWTATPARYRAEELSARIAVA